MNNQRELVCLDCGLETQTWNNICSECGGLLEPVCYDSIDATDEEFDTDVDDYTDILDNFLDVDELLFE